MSKNLQDQPTTTTTPTSWFVNIAGAVRQYTAAAFASLIGALIGTQTHAASAKTTLVDADELPLSDSAASNVTKKITWANLWVNIKAKADTVYAALVHTHDAGDITSGTLDPARIPVLYSGVHVASSGDMTALTSDQQAAITNGAIVTTTDGKRWCYTGSGSKTNTASYIELGDTAPAWSIITGKPSTFAPSAHATSHQSGGADAIKLDALAAPDDNTNLNATTSAHGLMSKADKAKMDGVAAGADVTGAAIHAATAKTTPVDGDEFGIIDSAAINALKKVTWANIKATAKTYFDTLYAALAHAARHKSGGADAIKLDELDAPTDVTTLDATTSVHGLMSKADKLKLDNMTGDGSSILRATGTLQAFTTAAGPPTPLTLNWGSAPVDGEQLVFSSSTAGSKSILFKADGSGDIDISSGDPGTINNAVAAFITAASMSGITAGGSGYLGTGGVQISDSATGAAEQLQATTWPAGWTPSGGGYGTDPSGSVTELLLAAGDGTKQIKLIRASVDGIIGGGTVVALYLKSSSNVYTQLTAEVAASSEATPLGPVHNLMAGFNVGVSPGEALYAELYAGTLPIDSTTCFVEAVFEQS